ncbi:MAG TPA: T9SS type A sorting domain-containing protein [Hanamia sp.]|nr:T9SS type A sorting domain-containing protein [Hanamia sp.]
MKKMLHTFKILIIGSILIIAGVNSNAQNVCAASNTISPTSIQNICMGSSVSNTLTATITTSGSGSNGSITYTWYSNTNNSTSGGSVVQTLSTNSATITNTFTPPVSNVGTLWYYCTVTNDGGDCDGTSFTTAVVQVNVNSLPSIFNVTGGGARCSNGPGVSIYLSNTQGSVIKYQLVRDGAPVGTALSGTGRSLGFLVTTAGTFTMQATNSLTGCVSNMNGNAIVTINPKPSVTYSKTDVSCQGADGSITVTGSGGTPAYLFNLDGGSFSSNNFFTGLTAGEHSVSVKDANSCMVSLPNITISNASPLSVGINQVNPGNCTGSDGSITVSMIGGVDDGITPVEFKLDGDATMPYQTSNVFGNLSKGSYTVTVKDSKGCTGVSPTVTLTQNAGTAPNIYNVSGGGTRCSNGSGVSIYLSGSQTGITYQLERDASPVGTALSGTGNPLSFVLSNAGSYTIVATNSSAGCTSVMNGTATIVVNQAPAVFNVSGGGSRCSNGSGVGIFLSGSEIGVNYQLQRDGGPVGSIASGNGSKKLSFIVSTAGTYTIKATNATTNCTMVMNGSAIVTINQAPQVFTVSGGGTSCSPGSSVPITLSGSETGVSYQLNSNGFPVGTAVQGNGSPLTFTTSTAGTYKVLATNATSGCLIYMAGSSVLTQNPPLTPSYTKYYASSCVGGDGTITITPGGGTPGYMYSVDDGPFGTDNFLTGLAAGDHKVVIKDANSCTFTYEGITVLTAPIMKVNGGAVNPGSCTGNDGVVSATGLGGVQDGITPLEYMLNGDVSRPFQISNSFGGLAPGNYSVTVKDSKGCLAQSNVVTLTLGTPISISTSSYSTNVSSCGNGMDGSISTVITGGVSPYTYKINGSVISAQNGSQYFRYSNLGIGNYTVEISDRSGCTVSRVFSVDQASTPVATVAYRGNETCTGGSNGFITLSPTGNGGVPGYMFSKDGGTTYQGSYSFTNLASNTYSMVVKDSKGCVSAPVAVTIYPGTANCVSGRIGNPSDDDGTKSPIVIINKNSDLSKTSFNSSLSIQAFPNPFGYEFTLNVQGNNQDRVYITITDVLGRRLYQAEGNANQQYKLGNNLGRGIYIAQVMQGNNVQTIKIVKE